MNDRAVNGKKIYIDINNIFMQDDVIDDVKKIAEKVGFNISSEHFKKYYDVNICSEEEFTDYIDSTLQLFKTNRANGKKLLVSLESILRKKLIIEPLRKTGNTYPFINITMDIGLKYNAYSWIVLADNYPNISEYGNAIVVIPFEKCQYPWYNTTTKKMNMKGLSYSYPCEIQYSKGESECFDGKWRMSNDYNYARDAIKRYIYKNKNVTIDKFVKINLKKVPVSTFSIAFSKNDYIFIGKAKDYLYLHKKYIEEKEVNIKKVKKVEEKNTIKGNDNKMIVLTRDMIHSCKTSKGGFTNAQIKFLGLNPKTKWLNKAVGMMVTKEKLNEFKRLAGTYSKTKKKQNIKNSLLDVNDVNKESNDCEKLIDRIKNVLNKDKDYAYKIGQIEAILE